MGNKLLSFMDESGYQTVEGVAFGVLVGMEILLLIICGICMGLYVKRDYTSLKKKLHTVLTVIYPNLIAKEVYVQGVGNGHQGVRNGHQGVGNGHQRMGNGHQGMGDGDQREHVAVEMENRQEKEAYLFGDKEFRVEKDGCLHDLTHCYTYFYFISVAILASFCFLAMLVENGLYRKTTTCNDINVEDSSYACFNMTRRKDFKLKRVDCSLRGNGNINVFCYWYQPNAATFGIAFSTFSFVLVVVAVYFKIAIKIVEFPCVRYLLAVLQICAIILSSIVLLAILPTLHYTETKQTKDTTIYFFHGNAVVRWALFFLTHFTVTLVIPVPWCGFTHKDTYKTILLKKKQISTRRLCQHQTVVSAAILTLDNLPVVRQEKPAAMATELTSQLN